MNFNHTNLRIPTRPISLETPNPYSAFSSSTVIYLQSVRVHTLYYFGRDRKADIPQSSDLNTMLLVNLMQAQGRAFLVESTVREHERRLRDDVQKTDH